MKPITVLMAVYNEQKTFLESALLSILHQTFSNFEFLIIDDGSTDIVCRNILKEYALADSRIRLIHNAQNKGLTITLNQGIQSAEGKYIARIDSNDIAHPDRLLKQFTFMENHPDHTLIGSWSYLINEDDEIIGKKQFYTNYTQIRSNILRFNFFTHSSLFFRTDAVKAVGGYSSGAKKAQDYDLILKLASTTPIANVKEFLCFYRISPQGISESQYKKQEYFAVRARLKAIFSYGYSPLEIRHILIPLFSFLFIPTIIKKLLIRFIH